MVEVRELLKQPIDFLSPASRRTFGTGDSDVDAFTIMKLMGHSAITSPRGSFR